MLSWRKTCEADKRTWQGCLPVSTGLSPANGNYELPNIKPLYGRPLCGRVSLMPSHRHKLWTRYCGSKLNQSFEEPPLLTSHVSVHFRPLTSHVSIRFRPLASHVSVRFRPLASHVSVHFRPLTSQVSLRFRLLASQVSLSLCFWPLASHVSLPAAITFTCSLMDQPPRSCLPHPQPGAGEKPSPAKEFLTRLICLILAALGPLGGTWACFCSGARALEHTGSVVVAHRLSCSTARGILVPWRGSKPTSPTVEDRFPITGPPGKSCSGITERSGNRSSSWPFPLRQCLKRIQQNLNLPPFLS